LIQGKPGDVFIDTETGDIYKKESDINFVVDENACVGGTATANSVYNAETTADKAFDGDISTFWHSASTSYPIYIQYEFLEPQEVVKLRIFPLESFIARVPRDFTLVASNTGLFSGEEVEVVSYANQGYTAYNWKEFSFDSAGIFTYYRLVITGADTNYQNIKEIQMMSIGDTGWQRKLTGMSTFLAMMDTPATYSGTEGLFAKSTGSGIEFEEVQANQSFLNLTDTPTTFSGGEGDYLKLTASGVLSFDGIIITSPNMTEWLIKVTDQGTLYTEEL